MNTTGKKFGGRKKGTPNRLTKELRALLKEVLHKELKSINTHLDELNSKERLEIIIKLLPYVFPKVESTSHTTNEPVDWDI